jgi:hypothetical protein
MDVPIRDAEGEIKTIKVNYIPTTTTRDVAIAAGGTAQVLMAANPVRRAMGVFNPDQVQPLWASFSGAAGPNALGSFMIKPGDGFLWPTNAPTQDLSVWSNATGHLITAWETQ